MSVTLFGLTSLTKDGVAYRVTGPLTYQTATVEQEGRLAKDGTLWGIKQTPVLGFIQFDVALTSEQPLTDWDNITSCTIVAEFNTGKTLSGFNMFRTKAPEGSAEEGTASIRLEGASINID